MKLKSFYAKTMTEAMQMVRDCLGEDAIIVATREEQGGKAVHITAAVEHEDHYPATPGGEAERDDAEDWLAAGATDSTEAVIEQLTDAMLRHAVPDEITDQIISCASIVSMNQAAPALVAALEHLYSFRPLPQKSSATAYMLVGAPGSGKTLAAAKLAARGVMAGRKVAVISTDTARAGAAEQLGAFTRLLRVDLHQASGPAELQRALGSARGADHIFIDTAGTNPFSAEEMRDTARLLAAGDIEPVLVLPAGIDADESGEIARAYATLGIRSLLPTRLDIARRLGGLLAAAHHGSLFFADASNNGRVADGLLPLSPVRLARLLLPQGAPPAKTTPPPRKHVTTG